MTSTVLLCRLLAATVEAKEPEDDLRGGGRCTALGAERRVLPFPGEA